MPRHPFLFLPGPMNHVYCRVARDEFVFADEAEEIPHLVGGVELAVSEDAVELLPNGVVRQTAARFEFRRIPGGCIAPHVPTLATKTDHRRP